MGFLDTITYSRMLCFRIIFILQVSVSGYNHKIAILLEKIIERIVNFEVKEDRFLVVKVRQAFVYNESC